MNGITLKHLRYFSALAAQQHFGRAAETCAISQPALSLQIKELEAILGGALVERTARRMRLTVLGEDFLTRAERILSQVDELEDLARSAEGPLSGRLRIGVIPTVAPYLLPDVIKVLGLHYPGLDLQPRESITRALVDDLMAARLDFAIMALPVSEPALQEFTLFDEDFFLVRPAGDAGLPVPSAGDLQTMRLLLLEEGHCFRDQALSFCSTIKSKPRQIMEGSSLSTLVQMVGAGIGVTLIPQMALAFETRSADVSIARFGGKSPSRRIGMVWRKTNPLGDRLMTIAEQIQSATRTAPESIAALA